jgi:hypothetical protein
MGAGKGDNNVSNEIEGEEQVEGLQDEADDENEEPEQDKKGKDDAVDMSDDFGGRMEDVPSDEEDENDDKKEDEQEGEEEEDPYDQIGQVDPLDPGAVDDKFWGGDNKEDEDDDEMKEETGQQPQETGDSEMGERKEGKQPEKKPDQADEQTEDSGAEMPEDDIQGDAADEDTAAEAGEELPEEDGQAEQQNRDQMPEMDMDAQALDLPEDLQLDAQPEDKDGLAEDEDLYMDTADADSMFCTACIAQSPADVDLQTTNLLMQIAATSSKTLKAKTRKLRRKRRTQPKAKRKQKCRMSKRWNMLPGLKPVLKEENLLLPRVYVQKQCPMLQIKRIRPKPAKLICRPMQTQVSLAKRVQAGVSTSSRSPNPAKLQRMRRQCRMTRKPKSRNPLKSKLARRLTRQRKLQRLQHLLLQSAISGMRPKNGCGGWKLYKMLRRTGQARIKPKKLRRMQSSSMQMMQAVTWRCRLQAPQTTSKHSRPAGKPMTTRSSTTFRRSRWMKSPKEHCRTEWMPTRSPACRKIRKLAICRTLRWVLVV